MKQDKCSQLFNKINVILQKVILIDLSYESSYWIGVNFIVLLDKYIDKHKLLNL